ncbi:hypothetical protein JCM30471_19340 [Desulfuromonas carbonis]
MARFRLVSAVLLLTSMTFLWGCSNSDDKKAVVQNFASAAATKDIAPGSVCANGGIYVYTGVDTNGNGILDDAEIKNSIPVCNGVDGADGADGATGPTGPAGPTGPTGADGLTSLILLTDAPLTVCSVGGVQIDTGIDSDGNGVLDAAEIDQTKFVCNSNEPAVAAVEAESCAVCHATTGAQHQAFYDQLYQDGVITLSNVAYSNDGTNDIVTFNMTSTKADAAADCTAVSNLNIYWVPFDGAKFQFNPAANRLSIKGTLTNNAGVCTSTKAQTAAGDLGAQNGVVVVYGYDDQVGSLPPSRVKLVKYPYAGLAKTGTVGYVSAANNAGCEKCHSVPFLKHGNIYGEVGHDPSTDFLTCKACHLDNGEGGHFEWQLAVDDPALWVKRAKGLTTAAEDAAIAAQYAYQTSLMNDVHMSHAMEFPYPQSMANCVTCHEGKINVILADANFKLETCKSCHPMNGGTDTADANGNFKYDFTGIALNTLIPHAFDAATVCNSCHSATGTAPVFSAIHTGFDTAIYDAAGAKYAKGITVSIDAATLTGTALKIDFSAAGTVGAAVAANIVPTVYVAGYGYDTKDFIISNHDRDAARNRIGEFTLDGTSTNPYFSNVVNPGDGTWSVTFDTSVFDTNNMVTDGIVKRLEIAVAPSLTVNGVKVGLDAPSKTFNLALNAFEDDFYSGANALVNVETGCNNCHDQLATTFHSPDRGGNIIVCRMCHTTMSGGSHLEMQSRSIDSYVHAIHSFQAFDPGDVDFNDPVEALHYEDHTELFPYPTHGIENCQSCHAAGTFNVPNQANSLPGLHSAADTLNKDRNIGAVPSYVTGPASRACGGCHRAQMINEDAAGDLAAFNAHVKTNGYLVQNAAGVLDAVIAKIMAMFQ